MPAHIPSAASPQTFFYNFYQGLHVLVTGQGSGSETFAFFFALLGNMRLLLLVLGSIAAVILVYASVRLELMRRARLRDLLFIAPPPEEAHDHEIWNRILVYLTSENSSDWKMAIIEADILLDDLLTRLGYGGDTLGEKLKGVEASDFATIDIAWEAHKKRNQITHGGHEEVELTKDEAQRIIGLYEMVFKEFDYI